jgi:hypothetical protein
MINMWGVEFDIDKIVQNFNSHQSFAKAKEIRLEDIPQDLMERFEHLSRRFIHPREYKPRDFVFSLKMDFDNGDSSYSALHPVIYNLGKQHEEMKEFDLYSMELDKNGVFTGRFEIRYQPDSNHPYFKNKPFVEWAETEKDFQHQGLGIRKHRTMGALSRAVYGLALHVDSNFEEEKRLIEKLASLGEVTRYLEGRKDRFVFV